MTGPTIIGKPTILVVDDNPEWLERLEFSLGDEYMLLASTDLAKAAEIAKRHWPEVMLLDWEIAKRDPEGAQIGIRKENEVVLPVILITGFERPEISNIAEEIGGCITIVERMETLEELKSEIANVVFCADFVAAR